MQNSREAESNLRMKRKRITSKDEIDFVTDSAGRPTIIGHGAFGEVKLVRHKISKMLYAMKIVCPFL